MMPWRRDPAAATDSDALDRIRGLLQRPHDPVQLLDVVTTIVRRTGRACLPYRRPGNGVNVRLDSTTVAAPAGVVDFPGLGTATVRIANTDAGPQLAIAVATAPDVASRSIRVTVDGHTTYLGPEPA